MQGLADGNIEVIGHHRQKEDLGSTEKVLSKELCHARFKGYGIFSPNIKSEINLGETEEEEIKSINDKLARKKYIGELRVLLTVIVKTMSTLPTMVNM